MNSVVTQDASGNIGIGTTTPAAALDVASGNLNIAGNLFKGGSLFMHNSGFANTFLGQSAGNVTIAGNNNVGVGIFALFSKVTREGAVSQPWIQNLATVSFVCFKLAFVIDASPVAKVSPQHHLELAARVRTVMRNAGNEQLALERHHEVASAGYSPGPELRLVQTW